MKIHEYQAKELLRAHGVPVPRGYPAFSVREAEEAAQKLGVFGSGARVEARGAGPSGERITIIAGAAGSTAELAAAVCAATTLRLLAHPIAPGVHGTSCHELDQLEVLHHATRLGVRVQEFTGVARATAW